MRLLGSLAVGGSEHTVASVMRSPRSPLWCAQDFRAKTVEFFGDYLGIDNLYLGCARNLEPGFVNLDVSPNVGADVVHDCEILPLPFGEARFDCVFGSHFFEHIRRERFLPLVGDLVRILRPGGYLISVTPYCSSDDAVDNPFHFQAFSESTWHYADRRLYQNPTTAGNGDFGVTWALPVIFTALVPYPEYVDSPNLEFARRHYRNVIKELHVVLRKPGGQ